MSARRGGLGRGLESLIPGLGAGDDAAATNAVDVGALEPNPLQPRVRWNEDDLESLAASIREHGIIQPIVVTRGNGAKPFQIIAGERRWRAAQRAGLTVVPVLIREATPTQLLELALVENIQRADLNPIEEALAYRQLTTEFGLKQSEVAERVGKSRPAVANTLRLLSAPDIIRDAVANDDITAGHAKALLAVENAQIQEHLLKQVIIGGLNVRDTERLVQRTLAPTRRAAAPKPSKSDDAIQGLERALQHALSTNVSIKRSGQAGQIIINFYSDEELNAVLDRIMGLEDEL